MAVRVRPRTLLSFCFGCSAVFEEGIAFKAHHCGRKRLLQLRPSAGTFLLWPEEQAALPIDSFIVFLLSEGGGAKGAQALNANLLLTSILQQQESIEPESDSEDHASACLGSQPSTSAVDTGKGTPSQGRGISPLSSMEGELLPMDSDGATDGGAAQAGQVPSWLQQRQERQEEKRLQGLVGGSILPGELLPTLAPMPDVLPCVPKPPFPASVQLKTALVPLPVVAAAPLPAAPPRSSLGTADQRRSAVSLRAQLTGLVQQQPQHIQQQGQCQGCVGTAQLLRPAGDGFPGQVSPLQSSVSQRQRLASLAHQQQAWEGNSEVKQHAKRHKQAHHEHAQPLAGAPLQRTPPLSQVPLPSSQPQATAGSSLCEEGTAPGGPAHLEPGSEQGQEQPRVCGAVCERGVELAGPASPLPTQPHEGLEQQQQAQPLSTAAARGVGMPDAAPPSAPPSPTRQHMQRAAATPTAGGGGARGEGGAEEVPPTLLSPNHLIPVSNSEQEVQVLASAAAAHGGAAVAAPASSSSPGPPLEPDEQLPQAPSPAAVAPARAPVAAHSQFAPSPASPVRDPGQARRLAEYGELAGLLQQEEDRERLFESLPRLQGPLPAYEYVLRSGGEVIEEARAEELAGVRQALEVQDPLSAAIVAGVLRLAEEKVELCETDLAALLAELGLGGEQHQGPPQEGLHREPGAVCALMLSSMVGLAVSAMEGGILLPERRLAALLRARKSLQAQASRARQRARQRTAGESDGGGGGEASGGSDATVAEGGELAPLEERLRVVGAAIRRLKQPEHPASAQMLSNFRTLLRRMAATPHAELRTGAGSQAEVLEQLRQCGAFQEREWVQITPQEQPASSSGNGCGTGAAQPCRFDVGLAARLLAGRREGEGGGGSGPMPLVGGRCSVSANDGQQVFSAQDTDCGRVVALGRAHLLLLRRMMQQHAQLLGTAPWSPDKPAHQALYWLALGMSLVRKEACLQRVGYYHAELSMQAPEVAVHLGMPVPHPSLAPPPPAALAGYSVQSDGFNVALTLERSGRAGGSIGSSAGAGGENDGSSGNVGGCDPGAWPWLNCSSWGLTDGLSGPLLHLLAQRGSPRHQLPILPGINCSFGIVTAAANLAVHVEDFCGGSTNTCWAGFKLWLFVPTAVLEARRSLSAKLMSKQLPPEWLLASTDILPHVELALQLPGQQMIIKPGKAYHGVSVPGFCLAEAGNHWHMLHRGAPGVPGWLEAWCKLQLRSSSAWHNRMRPLWCFFHQLHDILEACSRRLQQLTDESGALARALVVMLGLEPSS